LKSFPRRETARRGKKRKKVLLFNNTIARIRFSAKSAQGEKMPAKKKVAKKAVKKVVAKKVAKKAKKK
jgi:hypothetical protein